MRKSVAPKFQIPSALLAAASKEALQQWNDTDSARPSWDSVEPLLRMAPGSLLVGIARREQTACSEVERIQRDVAPRLKRLEKQVNAEMNRLKRRVRATLKRIGNLPLEEATKEASKDALNHREATREALKKAKEAASKNHDRDQARIEQLTGEDAAGERDSSFLRLKSRMADLSTSVVALGVNERKLRAILDVQPFSFPELKPFFFPKNDRVAIYLGFCALKWEGRSWGTRDLALASLLLGNRPRPSEHGYDGWSIDDVIAAEQDAMQKAVQRAQERGLGGLDGATIELLLRGTLVQAVPESPADHLQE